MPPLADRGAAQVAAERVRSVMWAEAGIARTAKGLRSCLATLDSILARLPDGATEERNMDAQHMEGPAVDPGLEGAEANAVRLATAIDPRLAEVWTTLFAADLDAADLSEQVGWFLRMAYLRGYYDGLCEPDAGSLYRDLGMRVPPRRRTATTRPGTTHRREA